MNGLSKLSVKWIAKLMKYKPIAKAVTKISHNKPEIMAITGGAAVIAAFIMAIVQGMKVGKVMEVSAQEVERLESEQAVKLSIEDLTEEQKAAIIKACGKDLKKARVNGVWQVTKLFLLPAGLLVIGLSMMGGGHHVLKKRNIVLAGVAEGYKKTMNFYRKNVIADQGVEADQKYMRGIIGEQIEEKIVKDENGKNKKVVTKVPVVRKSENPWRFEFSQTYFWSWEDDTDRNLFFLKCEQDWWNHEFERNGEVSIYEILKHLRFKFDVMKEGMSPQQYREWMTFIRNFGWRKNCGGDDFIDFGIYRAINEPAVTRTSDMIFIEFNCDGNLETLAEWPYVDEFGKQNTRKYEKGAKSK